MDLLRTPKAVYTALDKRDFYDKTITTSEGYTFYFTVAYYPNRSGFVHFGVVKRLDDYAILGNSKVQYYNRTWEKYTGQTAYKKALWRALLVKNIDEATFEELRHLLD